MSRSYHGMTKSKLYGVWKGMRQRCSRDMGYRNRTYIAKGISVCALWHEFVPFMQWALANGYAEGLHLDRIDGDGDYEPKNCRFVTPAQNASTRDTTKKLSHEGRTMTVREWGDELGVNPHTINTRLVRGWSVADALTRPIQKRSK